jgi:predicted P-loop ATPase
MTTDKKGPAANEGPQKRPLTIARGDRLHTLELQDYLSFTKRELSPRFNRRSRLIEFQGVELETEAFEALHLRLAEGGIKASAGNLQLAVRHCAAERSFDPVADYLNGLATDPGKALTNEEWDQIAVLCFGLEGVFEGEAVRKYLLSCVGRALQPGCKVDQALILQGRQGLKKSSWFRVLAGPFFTDSLGDNVGNKDEVAKLHMAWIAEWAEFEKVCLGANGDSKLKTFVTAQDDLLRVPYGKNTAKYLRQSVLVGTTNRDDFLSDPSGNRRHPVLSPKVINLDWVEENRDRIWARAVAELRRGSKWVYSQEQEAEISERAKAYAQEDPWAPALEAFFKTRPDEPYTMKEVWVMALAMDPDAFDRRAGGRVRRSMQACFANRATFNREAHSPRKASCGGQGMYSVVRVGLSN